MPRPITGVIPVGRMPRLGFAGSMHTARIASRPAASRTALVLLASIAFLPVTALALLAAMGVITAQLLELATPAAMLLPGLGALVAWLVVRPEPFARFVRLRAERGPARLAVWTAGAFVVVTALGAMTAGVALLVGAVPDAAGLASALPALPVALATMLVLAAGEELGWRGAAQRMLAPLGWWRCALTIGASWALWHLPALAVWVLAGAMPLGVAAATLASLVVGGVVLSALSTLGGGVLPAVVGHAAMNTTVVVATSGSIGGDPAVIGWIGVGLWAVAAGALGGAAARTARRER